MTKQAATTPGIQQTLSTAPAGIPDDAADEPPVEVDPAGCEEITPGEALERLVQTGVLERVLVRGLRADHRTFDLPIRIVGCFLADVDLRGAVFEQPASFHGTTFDGSLLLGDDYDGISKATRSWDVNLGTRFEGDADFSSSVFRGPVYATGARFGRNCSFRHAAFRDLAAFPAAVFEGKAWFVRVRCDGSFSMREARFHGELGDFSASRFHGDVTFLRAVFDHRSSFWGSSFRGGASLHLARFAGDTNFVKARFGGLLDISRAAFAWPLDLHDTELAGAVAIRSLDAPRVILERRQVAGRIESERVGIWSSAQADYGQLKHIFESNNDYDGMDWAYYGFRRARRRARTKNRLVGLLEWVFLDGGTGYGTKPFNIGLLILAAVIGFGLVYAAFPSELYYNSTVAISGSVPGLDPVAAVYFSMATLTTIGLGDWIPRPDGWMRFVITAESLLGFFLMALFVAMLTRRVVR